MRTVMVLVTYDDEIQNPTDLEAIWVTTSQHAGVQEVIAAAVDDETARSLTEMVGVPAG